MNLNAVHAQVRLYVPEAGIAEMNKYLNSAMDQVNARGMERVLALTVVSPTGEYTADPLLRTDGQAFNYYPLSKCLVLPSTVSNVDQLFLNGVQLSLITMTEYIGEPTVQCYYISDTGEIYFALSLTDGDVVKITGRAAGLTPSVLPDRFIPYFTYTILTGLYSDEYKNPDQYAIYVRKAKEAFAVASFVNRGKTYGMRRNGRLY